MSKPKAPAKVTGVNIKRPFYTMAQVDGENAEITMYGDIVESQPVDPWTGEPIPGSYIIESEFLEDLQKVSGCKALTIRMNSLGGDAGVSILIHNRLRELSAAGCHITCIVDGVAMSGGSLIMCAADTVKVNPSSLVMIHRCWTFLFGGYNADEMRQQAAQNDAWDKAQVSIYNRKTGLSETVLIHMMGDTTYMTGKEAVEKGFADELMENPEPLDIAASADGRSLFVRGRKVALTSGLFAPDFIPTQADAGAVPAEVNKTSDEPDQEGGQTPMANSVEELKKEYPELVSQIEAAAKSDAIDGERKRLKDIDAVAGLFDPTMVEDAKYGETACSAADLAYRAAQQAAKNGSKFMADLNADAESSGSADVGSAPADDEYDTTTPDADATPEQRMAAARATIKALYNNK